VQRINTTIKDPLVPPPVGPAGSELFDLLDELQLYGMKAAFDEIMATAYARRRVDAPRQFVIIVTTNTRTFLRDPTGNRRFWPVNVTRYDGEAFQADRDQIFAEAFIAAQNGPLFLDEQLEADMCICNTNTGK
jgi:hypothetical protein